ncbi:MAG: 6-pyruvoyl-tetrahydropterin synthase-related protein [Patescibacteria group bacterium]
MKFIWVLIPILIILGFISSHRLFRPGFFSMQDDIHVFRLQQYDKCFHDGQIPCRYIPDGGLGYGYPLFNYYSPLTYSIAEIFHLAGFSYINSIKSVFVLGFFIGTFGMFLFTRLFWGNLGGLISTIIFSFSPYRAVDSYVRGAIAEFFSLNLFPLVFWSIIRYLKTLKFRYFMLSVVFLTSLFLCHNLMTLAVSPVLILFIGITLFRQKQLNFKYIIKFFSIFLISFCLASFFLLPALFEKNLVTIETMTQGYFNFVNHFTTLSQLFINHNDWGYGASLWGPKDDMSFQIGYIQWLLPLFIFLASLFIKFKKDQISKLYIYLFFILFIFYSFLTHNKSTFIWQALPFMDYFQFPWRFLSVVIFLLSFISGSIVQFVHKRTVSVTLLILIFLSTILLNINFFKEDIWFPNLTDNQKLTGAELVRQSGAGLMDYWPKGSLNYPIEFSKDIPTSDSPLSTSNYTKKSNLLTADITVSSPNTLVTFPLVYFPIWKLTINNHPGLLLIDNNLGLIQTKLQPGIYHVSIDFINTPIRTISNIISLVTLLFVFAFFYFKRHEI